MLSREDTQDFPLTWIKALNSGRNVLEPMFKPECPQLITESKILRVRGRTGLVGLGNVDSS